MAVWHRSSFRTDMEVWFPKKLNVVSWEQQIRAGRSAMSWSRESLIPQSSKSRVFSVSATLSSRTWRGSGHM
jgi:hypothetical protein